MAPAAALVARPPATGGANAGVSGTSSTSPSLINVNAGANGTTSASSTTSGGSLVNVNANSGQAGTSSGGGLVNVNTNTPHAGSTGLVKSVLGTVANAATAPWARVQPAPSATAACWVRVVCSATASSVACRSMAT